LTFLNASIVCSIAEAVHIGVRGIVTDRASGEPVWAEVRVEGNSHPVFTDPNVGDYHRMLLPGVYNLTFNAPGYAQKLVENVVVANGPATRLDVELSSVDLDDNGDVDLADFVEFGAWWLETGCCECGGADFSGDGDVGADDLEAIGENWLTGVQ